MKKVIAAIISLLFLLTLSGCGFKISYWGGMTRNQCEKYVTEQLKEKYNEEFTVVKFFKSGTGKLEGVCAPKRDESLLFDIELDKGYKDELEIDDAYIQGIVRMEMLDNMNVVLSKHFDNYACEIWIQGLLPCYDSGITDASEASIKTYTETISDEIFDMWIVFNEDEIKGKYERIEPVLREASENFYKSKISINCYILNGDILNRFKSQISNNHIEFGYDILDGTLVVLSTIRPRYEYFYSFENKITFLGIVE